VVWQLTGPAEGHTKYLCANLYYLVGDSHNGNCTGEEAGCGDKEDRQDWK
jgi:hypothetical protein